jgi:hypothetical protein
MKNMANLGLGRWFEGDVTNGTSFRWELRFFMLMARVLHVIFYFSGSEILMVRQ